MPACPVVGDVKLEHLFKAMPASVAILKSTCLSLLSDLGLILWECTIICMYFCILLKFFILWSYHYSFWFSDHPHLARRSPSKLASVPFYVFILMFEHFLRLAQQDILRTPCTCPAPNREQAIFQGVLVSFHGGMIVRNSSSGGWVCFLLLRCYCF